MPGTWDHPVSIFAEDGDPVSLTREERDMLDVWCALPPQKRRLVVELLRNP